MAQRPQRPFVWAWNAAVGAVVEPPSGLAEAGWAANQKPPAPYVNFAFNTIGAWVEFLRGPNLGQWNRAAWATSPAAYDAGSAVTLRADGASTDAARPLYRFVATGTETTGTAPTLRVSQRGNAWERRTLPGTLTGTLAGACFAPGAGAAGRWLVYCTDATVHYTIADDGTTTSGIASSGGTWTQGTVPGATSAIVAMAGRDADAQVFALTTDGGIYSTDGGLSWSAYSTSGTARAGTGRDVVWTGSKFVFITADGEVYAAADANVAFAYQTTLAGGAAAWRLAVGDGELVAFVVNNGTAQDHYVSDDDGATWTAETPSPSPASPGFTRLESIAYHDGTWVAATRTAPYLWSSNDHKNWVALAPEVDNTASDSSLRGVAYQGGAFVAVGNGFALVSGRAQDPAPGTYGPATASGYFADAGYLRGRTVASDAPSNGDVLTWDAAQSRWEPAAPAGGGDATSLQGNAVANTAPSSRQYLRWNASSSEWEPASLPWETDQSTGVQTTDATTTTCGTYTPAAGGHAVEVTVRAERADLGVGAMWVLRAHVKNVTGTVSISNNDYERAGPIGDAVDALGWAPELDVSGGAVRLRVTGQAATTIDWTARWTVK